MAKKFYTILIASEKSGKIKNYIISSLTLKIFATFLGIAMAVFSLMICDNVIYKKKIPDLQELRAQTHSQQAEIHSLMAKVSSLEEQTNRLKEIEKQMKRDLKEAHELKKAKKAFSIIPKKKIYAGTKEGTMEVTFIREDEVSLLDNERPPLISHLRQDLLKLRKEAYQRRQKFQEFQELLRNQKSILLAIPSLWPVLGRISSEFGDTRLSGSSGGTRPHRGVDIAAPLGSPIAATAGGTVSFAGRDLECGRLICIDHGHGFSTIYGHLKEIFVQTGDKIREGQTVGTVGSSGNSTGPHLHYEVRLQGNPVNPAHYLNQIK
ncbi:MAG: peptidoglycan DD-metalloendopeptidase family protein [Deltaproteobacteria bacterium]|nr:peptidoglycan DD-metalloendopeptidase family protein [Deltaproteobacteria bacterium]